MNLNLFPVPIRQGYIVPSDEQLDDTTDALFSFFDDAKKGEWALESGQSTAGVGGDGLFNDPVYDWLTLPILDDVRDYWLNTLHYRRDYHMYMDSMWANLHYEGDSTGEHCHVDGHGKSHISLVYYLKKDSCGGHLQFRNPLEDILRHCPLNAPYDDWARNSGYSYDWKTVPMAKDEYVMFPSWLKHRTQPNTDCERIAISMNFSGFPHHHAEHEANEWL